MNTFGSLQDLLINAADVYRKAADLFDSLKGSCENPRVAMLLKAMGEQSSRLAGVIDQFINRADKCVLDIRLQYSVEIDSDQFVDALAPDIKPLDLEAVNQLYPQVYDYQVALMEKVKDETSSGEAHQLLDDILQILTAESRNFSKQVASTLDI